MIKLDNAIPYHLNTMTISGKIKTSGRVYLGTRIPVRDTIDIWVWYYIVWDSMGYPR